MLCGYEEPERVAYVLVDYRKCDPVPLGISTQVFAGERLGRVGKDVNRHKLRDDFIRPFP